MTTTGNARSRTDAPQEGPRSVEVGDSAEQASTRRVDPLDLYLENARQRDPRRLLGLVARALQLTWTTSRRHFVGAAVLQVSGALSLSALVVVSQRALDALLAIERGTGDFGALVATMVLLSAVTAVGSAATVLQQQQQRLLGEEVQASVWSRMLDVTGRVSLNFFERPGFYDQLERVKTNALSQPANVTSAAFGLIGGLVGTVGLLLVLVAVEPLLVPVLALSAVPSILLSRRASRTEFGFAVRAVPLWRGREYLRTVLTGRDEAKEVRAFGAERVLRTRHDGRSDGYLAEVRAQVRTRQCYALGAVLTGSVALAVSLGLLVWFLSSGRITLAEAGGAALGVRLLSTRLDQLFKSIGGLLESSVFLADLERFLQISGIADGAGTGMRPTLRRRLAVREVSYTYPGSTTRVLHEIELEIGAGEVVALVGENGSGKTTLAKVIAGLYRPTAGQVTWDGVDVATLEPADVRRGVAVVFQDFVRYQLSALENIGLGDPDHIDDEPAARAAAERAGAAAFLDRLPDGYDTILSKELADGHDLSVGEWQRVALARALRRDAPLVILDEPSSALDPRAEQALFADVRATLHGRSALLISHRYSTVRTADRICVMRGGRIVETGSHDALMAEGGLYAELFSMQADAYR